MPCVAPSEVLVHTSPALRLFGLFAEARISRRYLKDNGRQAAGFFPPSTLDFTDKTIKGVVGNIKLFTDYIQSNNSHVDVIRFEKELRTKDKGAVPDIASHLKTISVFELYEIKPRSNSGIKDGQKKLVKLDDICKKFTLPYQRGTKYSPNVRIQIWRGRLFGANLNAFLQFERIEPGLIVYQICIEGELKKLAFHLLLLAIATIIIIVVATKRVPIPSPGKPAPGDPPALPPPVPSPFPTPNPGIPVPAFLNFGIRDNRSMSLIGESVGQGGRNKFGDVKVVQLLLNDWLGRKGGNLLKVDGLAGPKTVSAISQFQNSQTKWVDGRADKCGRTIQMLLANHLNNLASGVDQSFVRDLIYQSPVPEQIETAKLISDYMMELRLG
jgi:hypothetical protein